jgi:hypothetical protein
MSNEFKSFYLKDIQDIINKAALSIMMQPQRLFMNEQAQNVESLAHMNDRVSQYNDGVRALAVYLNVVLEKDGDDDE